METVDDPKQNQPGEHSGPGSNKTATENTSLERDEQDNMEPAEKELETELKVHQAQTERD